MKCSRNWKDLTQWDCTHGGKNSFIILLTHLHNDELHYYHPGVFVRLSLYIWRFLILQHPTNHTTTFTQPVQVIVTDQGLCHRVRCCPCHLLYLYMATCVIVVFFSSLATLCSLEWDSGILTQWWGLIFVTINCTDVMLTAEEVDSVIAQERCPFCHRILWRAGTSCK